MDERDWLAERFQAHRPHLRAVAYRMLGSLTEADDAVQGTWLRLSRSRADPATGGLTRLARMAQPASRSRGTTSRPRVPVPPVTRIGAFITCLLVTSVPWKGSTG